MKSQKLSQLDGLMKEMMLRTIVAEGIDQKDLAAEWGMSYTTLNGYLTNGHAPLPVAVVILFSRRFANFAPAEHFMQLATVDLAEHIDCDPQAVKERLQTARKKQAAVDDRLFATLLDDDITVEEEQEFDQVRSEEKAAERMRDACIHKMAEQARYKRATQRERF